MTDPKRISDKERAALVEWLSEQEYAPLGAARAVEADGRTIAALVEALHSYGQHERSCKAAYRGPQAECDCGFRAALAAIDEEATSGAR